LPPPRAIAIDPLVFRRSSAVEQLTVNQLVVGSIPTAGAKFPKYIRHLGALGRFFLLTNSYKVL
jgi:hypothetical protein